MWLSEQSECVSRVHEALGSAASTSQWGWWCISDFKFKVILSYLLRLKANLGYMRPKTLGFINKTPTKNHVGFILTGLTDEYFIM